MKKDRPPRYHIIWMLAQPLAFAAFFVLGAWLDGALWQSAAQTAETGGHPAPVFSLLLTALGALVCLTVFVIALARLILCLRRRRRACAPAKAPPAAERVCPGRGAAADGDVCPYCGTELR